MSSPKMCAEGFFVDFFWSIALWKTADEFQLLPQRYIQDLELQVEYSAG